MEYKLGDIVWDDWEINVLSIQGWYNLMYYLQEVESGEGVLFTRRVPSDNAVYLGNIDFVKLMEITKNG